MLRLPVEVGNVIFHFTLSGIPASCASQYSAGADEFCRRSQVSSFSFVFLVDKGDIFICIAVVAS